MHPEKVGQAERLSVQDPESPLHERMSLWDKQKSMQEQRQGEVIYGMQLSFIVQFSFISYFVFLNTCIVPVAFGNKICA